MTQSVRPLYSIMLSDLVIAIYRMKARVEIEGRVWGKEGKSLSSL